MRQDLSSIPGALDFGVEWMVKINYSSSISHALKEREVWSMAVTFVEKKYIFTDAIAQAKLNPSISANQSTKT